MIVSISPVGAAKYSNHPDFFIGTTFWGEEFSTYEELCQIITKHAYFDGKWHPFTLGFMPSDIKNKVQAAVNARFAAGAETVDLVEVFSIDEARELRQTRIHARPGLYVIDKRGELTPRPKVKLLTVLQEIGLFK
jgi:hypothetical protein